MEANLEKLRVNIREALENVRQSYLIQKDKVEKKNLELTGRLQSMPEKSIQLLNIQRQQKILEDLYSFLLQKKIESGISSASTISNSKIIEPASGSPQPISPDKKKLYTLYLLFGLVVPIGAIAGMELLKDKVSNRADVERYTHAPILGEIGHSELSQSLIFTKNSRRFIAEQFRIIRTNLQYITSKKEKLVILVTSSFSGEAKSFVSINMGAVMALAGYKTVVMEFDIRKPKILSGLDMKRKLGITNYIVGKAQFNDLPVPVESQENLYVIPCGPIPPNPAELLLDNKLEVLMGEVINKFDVVILDTAPAGLVSDAITLGRFSDCTLYIVRQGHTYRKQLGLIEELYTQNKLPHLSLLLNDVRAEGGRGAVGVDLHRVVDHQVRGLERVDARGIAPHGAHRVAHGGEIDDRGHAGEVLEEHARRHERDLALRGTRGLPREERLDVLARHAPAVLAAQQVLEQDLEREGQPRRACAEHVEAMDQELRAADLEDASGVKAVSGARHAGTIYGSGAPFHGGAHDSTFTWRRR